MAYGQNIQSPNFSNDLGQTPGERWRFSTINDMMLSIDLAGLDYNDSLSDSMEGQHALRILTDILYETESEGWEYNTLPEKTLTLDENGEFSFDYANGDPYVFSLVGQNDTLFVSQDGKVRSRDKGYVLGKPFEEIKVNNIIIEDWANMHFSLTQFVSAKAINRFQALMLSDTGKMSYSQQEVQDKYIKARRDEIRSGKYNMLTSRYGTEVNR